MIYDSRGLLANTLASLVLCLLRCHPGYADSLEYGMYQCYLRQVAACTAEIPKYSTERDSVSPFTCQYFWKTALYDRASESYPNCKPGNLTCWLTCGDDLPLAETANNLSAPTDLSFRFANGPASNAKIGYIEWAPVPGAIIYFGQSLSPSSFQFSWSEGVSQLENVTVRNWTAIRFEHICNPQMYRIAAADTNSVGPFSEAISIPEQLPTDAIDYVDINPQFTAQSNKLTSYYKTDTMLKIGVNVSLIDDAYRERMDSYKIIAFLFVQEKPNSTFYFVVEFRQYHTNGAFTIELPIELSRCECDIILLIDSFEETSRTCPSLKINRAFRLNFVDQEKNFTCNSNTTRGLWHILKLFRTMEYKSFSNWTLFTIYPITNRTTDDKDYDPENYIMEYSVDSITTVNLSVSSQILTLLANKTYSETKQSSLEASIVKGLILIAAAVFLLVAVILVIRVVLKRRKTKYFAKKSDDAPKMIPKSNYTDCPAWTRRDQWEVQRKDICVLEEHKLGSGAFGNVFKGYLRFRTPICSRLKNKDDTEKDGALIVAVKTYQSYASPLTISNFREEIELMKTLGYNERLVNMLACVTASEPLLLVVEYCSEGDMLQYLKDRRAYIIDISKMYVSIQEAIKESKTLDLDMVLSMEDILCFAWQVCCGLQYLSDKGFIHRDIAARNVLVDKGKKAKIGDFGLCRFSQSEAVYSSRGGRLPIKWMALESLKEAEYTSASDVWSFGVLLFELLTLGGSPYPNIDPIDIQSHLQAGNRMDKPDNCSDELYSLMLRMWKEDPKARPTFAEMQCALRYMIESIADENYYLALNESKDYYNVVYKESAENASDSHAI